MASVLLSGLGQPTKWRIALKMGNYPSKYVSNCFSEKKNEILELRLQVTQNRTYL